MGQRRGFLRSKGATAALVAVLVAVPAGVAIAYPGFPVTDADLDTRTVWVTNGQEALAGRLNRQIEELDSAVQASSGSVDVLQDGEDVLLVDEQLGTIDRVDTAYTTLTERAEVAPGSIVAFHSSVLAVLDADSGELWTASIGGTLALDTAATDPVAELGPGADVVVGQDGTVYATSAENDELVTVPADGTEPITTSVPEFGRHELTAVGDTAVLLDLDQNVVITSGGARIELPEPGVRIQQAGGASDVVLVAGDASLMRVPLAGGAVETMPAGTTAAAPETVAAPVQLDGCAHAAWGGTATYLLACDGQSARTVDIPSALGGPVEFRVNRSVIALNELETGNVWLVDADMRLVDNWEDVTPPEEQKTVKGDEKSATQSFEETLADRTDRNRKPVANNDEFGVRPGIATVLPLLDNDSDPDGDVLTIDNFGSIPNGWGRLTTIDDGRALQLEPGKRASGQIRFSYSVDDGRGLGDQAVVTVRLREDGNRAPESRRTSAISVERGQTITYNVLNDWLDPDGDALFLESAAAKSGDQVRFTPDGFVTFTHTSGDQGTKEVQFTVSDGEASAVGTLEVQVKPAGSLDPIGTPDYARTTVGDVIEIEPLANDLAPSGDELELTGIDEKPDGADVSVNEQVGTISFRAGEAKPYYLIYSLSAGGRDSVGIIRVDVDEDPEQAEPPVAVADVAYMRAGAPTTVSVLANDASPSGNVLAVQSVDLDETADGLSVEVLGLQRIKVTPGNALTEATSFEYTVSDGEGFATTTVTVVPITALVKEQPPIALDDRVRVRAGDTITVDVLDNDYHPDAVPMHLEPDLLDDSGAGDGAVVFVSGDSVRYQAPDEPGQYAVNYRVIDDNDQTAVAQVRFTVLPADPAKNAAPLPLPITARVLAGETVTIDIPLDGVDPDGDSVIMVGLSSSPTKGRVIDFDGTTLTYKADRDALGTDVFEYRVQDTYGLASYAEVRIGVITPPENASPPRAVDDRISVRPERTVSVPVLANDSDPNGYSIRLDEVLEVDPGLEVEQEPGNLLLITAPDTEDTYTVRYQIVNSVGGTDTGFVQVDVSEDAPIDRPTAEDHFLTADDMPDSGRVIVDARDGASNPNGRVADLAVAVAGPKASQASVQENGDIAITPGRWRSWIAYTLTDEDNGLVASAFIVVPGDEEVSELGPPYLDPSLPEQFVDMNGTISWDLEDIVIVPSGQNPLLVSPNAVTATRSDGSPVYEDENTLTFRPAQELRGTARITFTVTDGRTPEDPTGRTAELVLPVTVGDPEFRDTPPTFTETTVQIQPGEAAKTLDLRDATGHPNPDVINEMRYENLANSNEAIRISQSGSELAFTADLGVQKGTTADATFDVGFENFTVPGSVHVEVVASDRPLADANDDTVDRLERGLSTTVDVKSNDWDPFRNISDRGLDVIATEVVNAGATSATATLNADDSVTVSAGATFIGTIEVDYTIRDATEDPDRDVHGRLYVTVVDQPDKPQPPTEVEQGDRFVRIGAVAPANNGVDIDAYEVAWTSSGGRSGSQSIAPEAISDIRIDGLVNGDRYRFTIRAHNDIGWGEFSEESGELIPFGKPTAPGSPGISSTRDGSGSITTNWGASDGNGRDVQQYIVELMNGGTAEQTKTVGGTTLSTNFTGAIGTTYKVRVTAVNQAGSGHAQTSSGSAVAYPGPARNIRANPTTDGSGEVTFSWDGPANGGVDRYKLVGCVNNEIQNNTVTCSGTPGSASTLTVRVVRGGVESDPVSASGTPSAPDPRTIQIVRGSSASGETSVNNADYVRANLTAVSGTHQMCVYQGDSPSGPWRAFNPQSGITCTTQTVRSGYVQAPQWMGCYSTGKWVRVTYDGLEDIVDYGRLGPGC